MIEQLSLLDRAAELRDEPGVIDRLRALPSTRVVVVRDSRLRLQDGRVLRAETETVGDAQWGLLGRDDDGSALLLAAVPTEADSIDAAPDEAWLGVIDAGGSLAPQEAELFVEAVALARWLGEVKFCSSCGGELELRQAGWSRMCPDCGAEHFPRTDPAVIVAVESPDGERLLLGSNAAWRGQFYSTFAGFIEAGESIEQTVHRELAEEAGVRVSSIRYISSQAWPYPRSLMIGLRVTAVDETTKPDGTEIVDVRWLTRDEIRTSFAGEGPVGVPGPASIARRLIEDWYNDRA